jgi:POT family proton-dependent oligopeptide transporter
MTNSTQGSGAAGGATFLGQPRGLATLFFTEMWERFTYYGMRALLLLFLVEAVSRGGFGIDDKTAAAIYGLYTAAVYVVAWPGGWIADRLIGAQRAVMIGGVLITLGSVLLSVPATPGLFYCGLIVIIFGVGLLKPNISAIVGALYPEGGARRDAGFSVFYMGINLGAFIGPLIAGWLASTYGWRWGFFSAAVGMSLGLLQFGLTRHHLGDAGLHPHTHSGADVGARSNRRDWLAVIAGLVAVAAIIVLAWIGVIDLQPVELAKWGTTVIVGMAATFFVYMLFFAGLDSVERLRIVAFVVLFFACALFWSGFEQAGSSFNLFAERYTNRMIGTWEMPSAFLQAVNPVFIIVFAPVFSWLWVALARRNLNPSSPVKFACGILLMGAGFLVMVGAARIVASGGQPLPYWLILTYLLHTFGELALSPVGLSTVTKLAPQRFVGQMMGMWFLATSLGNLIAGRIAGEFDASNVALFPGQFMSIVWFGAVAGGVLLLLSPLIRRWMGGVQ